MQLLGQPELSREAEAILRWRRIRRRGGVGLLLLLVSAVLAARLAGPGGTDHDRFHQRAFTVAEVPEGDELLVADSRGRLTRVRLLGVDTNGSPEARSRMAELAGGREVLLYLEDVPTRTRDGRLLAYAYADGRLLNEQIIGEGWGFADRRFEYAFSQMFVSAETEAVTRRRGMWPLESREAMPEWRQRWLAEFDRKPWERQEWRRRDEP